MTLLNIQRSANVGFLLVIIPFLLISGMILHYNLNFRMSLMESIGNWMASGDQYGIMPFLLIGAPLAAILINILAVTHFSIDKTSKEVNISFKYRWQNLIVLILAAMILTFLFLFLMVENINHG